ncbi:MAG: GNAT family N-acetyltransferase [FCB group bacterium]|nr:GNAT family N-acetyltransferase [FCB group bacterium]
MPEAIIIRDFKLEDYTALVQLWREVSLPYKPRGRDTLEKIAREILQPTAIFLVAEAKEQIIGAVLGTHDGRKGWINRLAVAPGFQGRGLGRRLIEAVEQRLDDAGIDIVACLIEDWNTVSQTVFTKCGYSRHDDIHYYSKRKNKDV